MVRLRREIDGVRRNYAVPELPWSRDPQWSAAALPVWSEVILEHCPQATGWPLRVGLAGQLPTALLAAVLARGHLVTWVEPSPALRDTLLAGLPAESSGRLTVVNKDYGDAALSGSAFDLLVLADTLAGYAEPRWVLTKLARELKPGGIGLLRAVVRGPLPDTTKGLTHHTSPAGAFSSVYADQWVAALRQASAALPTAPALVQQALLRWPAREAADRGAHLSGHPWAPEASAVLAATAETLTVTDCWQGHPDRLWLADLQWQARVGIRRAALAALQQVAPLGLSSATAPRLIALRAERRLAGWR